MTRLSLRRPAGPLRTSSSFGRALLTLVRVAADLAAICIAFALVYRLYVTVIEAGVWIWVTRPHRPGAYAQLTGLFGLVTLLVFWNLGLYRARASVLNLWELQSAVKGVALAGALFFCLLFFLKMVGFSRVVVVTAIMVALVLVIAVRRVLATLVGRLQLKGAFARRTLIYGCGATGQLLMKKIVQAWHRGCTVVGFLDDAVPAGSAVSCRISQTAPDLFRVSVVGGFDELGDLVTELRVDELLVAASLQPARLRQVLDFCRRRGLEVGVIPRLVDARVDDLVVEDLSAIPILRPRPRASGAVYRFGKRTLDLIAASLGLVLTSPVWVLAALLIRLDSPGPVFFVQERVGMNGRRFRMLKFRTMRTETDPYAHSPMGDVDERITRVGRILRVGGLDELPQLLNVLRGEMGMVGPRPEMPFIVEGYTEAQRARLRAKPGITGLWQVSADRHSEIHENIEYDLYYISHQSLTLDAVILVETVFFTLGLVLQGLGRRRSQSRPGLGVDPNHLAVASAIRANGGAALDSARPGLQVPAGGYLFVALDQRRGEYSIPASWGIGVPAVCRLSGIRWIKILVANHNRVALTEQVRELTQQTGPANRPVVECVTYHSFARLQELTRSAALVLTDLWHLERWAGEAGIPAVGMHGERLHWHSPSPDRETDVIELAGVLGLPLLRDDVVGQQSFEGRSARA